MASGRSSSPCALSAHPARLQSRSLGNKAQCDAVVAPPLARGRRTVVEQVTVVSAAFRAVILGAGQQQLEILAGFEGAGNGREEARPTRAALVLHRRSEEGQIAARAGEHARPLLGVERARTGTLGTLFA